MKSDRRAVAWQPSTSRADAEEAELRTVAVASGRSGGGSDGHNGKGDGRGAAHAGSMKTQRCSFMHHDSEPCMSEWTPFVALPARQLLFSRREKQLSCWREETRATMLRRGCQRVIAVCRNLWRPRRTVLRLRSNECCNNESVPRILVGTDAPLRVRNQHACLHDPPDSGLRHQLEHFTSAFHFRVQLFCISPYTHAAIHAFAYTCCDSCSQLL